MLNFARLLVSASVALTLTGCLVPEKFTAEAVFDTDGSYTYKFDGTVVNAMVATAKMKGELSDKDRASLAQENQKIAKAPGVKKFVALSDTRYQLVTEEMIPLERHRTAQSTNILVVTTQEWKKDRTLTVTGPRTTEKDRQLLQELGIKTDGIAKVVLPAGAKVLEHNARGTPGLFNKAYTWKVGLTGEQPKIRFQLPETK